MSFPSKVKEQVLLACKRYCCYCEVYCGVNIEVHHIVQEAAGGGNTADNAIPLCFNCHSEIGSYNPKHPKGNKYSVNELQHIRDEFYQKIANIPRKLTELSEQDSSLLEDFKEDFTRLIEYIRDTDLASELVEFELNDNIDLLLLKWSKKKYLFESINIEGLKIDVLSELSQLQPYLSIDYLRVHENSGKLIFKNQSMEEGEKLRNELQPNTYRIRTNLSKLLESVYMY